MSLCKMLKMENTETLIQKTKDHLSVLNQKTLEVRIKQCEAKISDLKHFCDHFDPYKELSGKDISFLKKYEILAPYDPFIITNKLLMLMENTIEELEELKNV